ncbi:MAG: (2Fe-2S)-binding protein [Gammaproteobacteria bacterium]|nr:(2Fe-2S)-binding protein [Gammaproteobacteria bacterium]MBT8150207.1 (2Fe-2S)-binding protein [Gammaproteobacteria bacterium]NNM10293.1 2Fe-2S iron-sulfur cluster binding domain-containing protein [Pseudomonadales bacterium]RZV52934.1 MAG: 2Fe-2S iron-sulfur cluster binding domain-containing protein [Pseudomonadales bacterium]
MTIDIKNPSFLLDGEEVPFTEGQTVMEAALTAGSYIPHLCFHPELQAHGSCRLCIVESDNRLHASCTLQANSRLKVSSQTQAINKMRKHIVQMLFVEGNHICPSCEFSGNCQLQAMAYELDMEEGHFHFRYPKREQDASHNDIFLDRDRCINCELCVRASRENDAKNVFSLGGRGTETHLCANSASGKLGDTSLDVSDKAANICPVGALLINDQSYVTPKEDRVYYQTSISLRGNRRPKEIE